MKKGTIMMLSFGAGASYGYFYGNPAAGIARNALTFGIIGAGIGYVFIEFTEMI